MCIRDRGNIDILAGISDFIHRSQQTYVVLSLGNSIYHFDFEEVVKNHIESQADVTILYKDKMCIRDRNHTFVVDLFRFDHNSDFTTGLNLSLIHI